MKLPIINCGGRKHTIAAIDSVMKTGKNALIIIMTSNINDAEEVFKNTSFNKLPLYLMSDNRKKEILIRKQTLFIKNACKACYERYKDDLSFVEYLKLGQGKITPVFSDYTQ